MTRRVQILNLEDPGSFSPIIVNVGSETREIQAGDYAEFSLSGQEAITVSEQRIHQKFDAKESSGLGRPAGTQALNFESTDDGKLKLADQEFGQEIAFDGNVLAEFKRAGHVTQDGELFTLHTSDKTAVYRAIDTYPPSGFLMRLVSVAPHHDNGGPLAPGQVSDGAGTETLRPGEVEPTGQPGTQSMQQPKSGVLQGGAQVAGEPAGGGYYRGGTPLAGNTGLESGQVADEYGRPTGTGAEEGQGSTFLPGEGAEPAGGQYGRAGDPTEQSDANSDEGRAERLRTQDQEPAADTAEDDEQPQRSDDDTAHAAEPVYEAEHRGGGSWSIMERNSGREVKEGLKKAEATKFNALSDEEKAEYIEGESDTETPKDDASA